jgi:hypothetical protein
MTGGGSKQPCQGLETRGIECYYELMQKLVGDDASIDLVPLNKSAGFRERFVDLGMEMSFRRKFYTGNVTWHDDVRL